jgi:hypothetical protein
MALHLYITLAASLETLRFVRRCNRFDDVFAFMIVCIFVMDSSNSAL